MKVKAKGLKKLYMTLVETIGKEEELEIL